MQSRMLMPTLFNRYKEKCLNVLNSSLAWNYEKLPNNTFELQIKKLFEEIDEAIEAEDYQRQVEELGDVLITIGGLARFDPEFAQDMFNEVVSILDKFLFMDCVDMAERKIPILYERSYDDGFRHTEVEH